MKKLYFPWLKQGAIIVLIIAVSFLPNVSVVLATNSYSSSSSSSSSSSTSVSASNGGTSSAASSASSSGSATSSGDSGSSAASASSASSAAASAGDAGAAAAAAAAAASSGDGSSASSDSSSSSDSSATAGTDTHGTSVSVSCSASASSAEVNSDVIFSAAIAGGSGSYAYSWSGSDSLSGSGPSVTKRYSTSGTKTAIVTVHSGSASASASCSVSITNTPPPPPTLQGSCLSNKTNARVGDFVTWSATGVTGGNGHYSYSWSGTDGLTGTGSSVNKIYATPGTKNATLTIYSGNQSIVRNCSTYIQPHENPNLAVSCSANVSSVTVGEPVSFSAQVTGGSTAYSYSWSGTDGLTGTGPQVSKIYNSAGSKNATVTVHSGAASATASCSVTVAQLPPPTLQGSCIAQTQNTKVGDPVTWAATGVSGGTGTYDYSWTGTDGLSGNNSSVTKAYGTAGTKNATLVINSGSQTITRNCSTYIQPLENNNLAVSCSASASSAVVGSAISFTSLAVGGTGNYTYSWSGTDSLSGTGSSVTKTYNSPGPKTANVTVQSGSSSATASCSVNINDVPPPQTLEGSCMANTSHAEIGETVTWSAVGVTGGIGQYTYSWTGNDGLSGNGSSVSKSYSTSGTKNATLVINSGNQTITRNCSTFVEEVPPPGALTGSCVANTYNGHTGDAISWTATGLSGGNGNYNFSWSGDDGLSGDVQTIVKIYDNSGLKDASVVISSQGQSITRNCSTYISTPYIPPNSTSTTTIIDSYNTYNDSHDTYSDSHDVYNDSHDTTNYYYNNNERDHNRNQRYENLNASCSANQTSALSGDIVFWSATGVTGGNGRYTYSWNGTDGLYGNNYSVSKIYNTPGTKFANLTVYSDGQSVTRTCSLFVNNRYMPIAYANPLPPSYPVNGVVLSQVPYTGLESNVKIILFTIVLAAWSALVTYIILSSRKKKLALATVASSDETEQILRQDVLLGQDRVLNDLESRARSLNLIISNDALEAIADMAGNDQKKAEKILNSLVSQYGQGDEWTTIDFAKVRSI